MSDKTVQLAADARKRIREAIEAQWLSRAAAQDYKRGTRKYAVAEAEYFCGAMAALNAAFPDEDPTRLSSVVPPIWIVNAMAGRNIVEVK